MVLNGFGSNYLGCLGHIGIDEHILGWNRNGRRDRGEEESSESDLEMSYFDVFRVNVYGCNTTRQMALR